MPILPQTTNLFLTIYAQLLAEELYADLLLRCHNHLLVKVAERLDFAPLEKACAAFHHQSGAGRSATYLIGCLVRATLVGWLYEWSLRELEQRLYSDLMVRWFVGLGPWGETPDHTTLARFVQWVESYAPGIYHDTVIGQILEHFPQERERTQIGDCYAMLANTADENLGRRIRHVYENLLVEMAKAMPGSMEQCLKGYEWVNLFGVYPEAGEWNLGAEQRKQRLSRIGLAADELHQRVEGILSQFSSRKYPQVRQWLSYLGKVLCDELCIDLDEAGRPVARELPKQKKGSFRLIGAADPGASLRAHGAPGHTEATLGYNVQIAVSTSGFIHETQAYTGASSDPAGVANLISAQIERVGSCPPKLIYDKAAGYGKTRGQVAQVSQGRCYLSAQLPDLEQRSPRFGPYDFGLSEDGFALTCPAGKVSTHSELADKVDGVVFPFYAWQCWNGDPPIPRQKASEEALIRRCLLWEQCRDPRASNQSRRTVFISNYRSLVLAAQVYNQSEAFKQDMQLRPRVERVVFELTHYNGARRYRRRGLANADFQAKMCAVAYNLKLWMRRLAMVSKSSR